jgi:uncharacterized membrane protein
MDAPISGILMLTAIEHFAHTLGGWVCHKIPERTLHTAGNALPVCARCTGVYTALFVTALVLWATAKMKPKYASGRTRFLCAGIFAVLCLIPMQLNGIANALGWLNSAALTRVLTGSAFGFGIALLIQLAWNAKREPPAIASLLITFTAAMALTPLLTPLFAPLFIITFISVIIILGYMLFSIICFTYGRWRAHV